MPRGIVLRLTYDDHFKNLQTRVSRQETYQNAIINRSEMKRDRSSVTYNAVDGDILRYLHESGAGGRATFVPRHASHDALALDVGATGVVSDTLSHKHDRLQDAGGWRFVGQEYNPTAVARYHRGGAIYTGEQRVFLKQRVRIGYHLHSDIRSAKQLR